MRGRTRGCGRSVGHASGLGLPWVLPGHYQRSTHFKPSPSWGHTGARAGPQLQIVPAVPRHWLSTSCMQEYTLDLRGRSKVAFKCDAGLERLARSPREVWPLDSQVEAGGGASGSGLATRGLRISCLTPPSDWASGRAGCPRQRPLSSNKKPLVSHVGFRSLP